MSECYIVCTSYDTLFLDIDMRKGGAKGSRVKVNSFTGLPTQRWLVDSRAQSIISVGTGRAIDIRSHHGPHKGSRIITWSWKASPNQLWNHDPHSQEILCPHYQLVLDISGAKFHPGTFVCAWSLNHKPQQHWTIYPCQNHHVRYVPPVPPERCAELERHVELGSRAELERHAEPERPAQAPQRAFASEAESGQINVHLHFGSTVRLT
jgi:hypothetical protein